MKARTKLPRFIANRRLLNLPLIGKQPVAYLFDVGFTRDVWMHRVDIAHALGYGLDFDAEHDGRLMEDYVAEWASVYDVPFTLHLTGPAGGSFQKGNGGETVTIDAVEFLRTVAEREHGVGLSEPPPSTLRGPVMETRVTEIAGSTYRLSTFVPEVGPTGFTFNQFLIDDDQPLLFHTGPRAMFPLVSEAIASILPVERLRWITFGHLESDECGAMNLFLGAAPSAEVAHGLMGCMVSLNDLCDRPPVPLAGDQVIELGAHRIRHIDTPHVPHGWDARVLYDETTGTLFAGDLFSNLGDPRAADVRRHRGRRWTSRRHVRRHLPHGEHRSDDPAAR